VFLQAVLQIFDCRWHHARLTPGAATFDANGRTPSKRATSRSVARTVALRRKQFRGQELFPPALLNAKTILRVRPEKQILSEPDLHLADARSKSRSALADCRPVRPL